MHNNEKIQASKKPLLLRTTIEMNQQFSEFVDDAQRASLIQKAKSFGSKELLDDIKDPTLVEVDAETALAYFGLNEPGIVESQKKGGHIRFFENTNGVIYISNNGYAGRTQK